MERFIGVEVNACPQVPGVSFPSVPLWNKASLVFIKPRRKASVQKACSMPKNSPVRALPLSGWVVSLPGCARAGTALLYQALPGARVWSWLGCWATGRCHGESMR